MSGEWDEKAAAHAANLSAAASCRAYAAEADRRGDTRRREKLEAEAREYERRAAHWSHRP